jgi:hypothetical protein
MRPKYAVRPLDTVLALLTRSAEVQVILKEPPEKFPTGGLQVLLKLPMLHVPRIGRVEVIDDSVELGTG